MTPSELKSIRTMLGITTDALATVLGVSGGRTVRRWEAGDRTIPGPAAVLLLAIKESAAVRAHLGLTGPKEAQPKAA